jgi:pilus assembly protein CpaB
MFLRRFLLVLGTIALLAGVGLTALWLASGPSTTVEAPRVAQQTILVAARPIAAGSLLRAEDIHWKQVAASTVADGSFVQGQVSEGDLFGAVARRDLAPGDALIAGQVIRPTESGFLAAVLPPGTRAVSIEVGPAESVSGLIAPGDRVDIILTQSFDERTAERSSQSVGETVLQNLRVVAVGQAISATQRPTPGEGGLRGTESHLPKTVTLEMAENQAEALMVALQIGKVHLALRSLEKSGRSEPVAIDALPTWGSDVSRALRVRTPPKPIAAVQAAAKAEPTRAIEILRGTKPERRCFDSSGTANAACGPSEAGSP